MGHHDALKKIDIAAARKDILKSISEYRRHHRLAELMEDFFKQLNDLAVAGKKIDARMKEKLHSILTTQAPELKVWVVSFIKRKMLMSERPEYEFRVRMYDMETDSRSWTLRSAEDGSLRVDDAMVADRNWAKYADFLESRMAQFAYRATKFNEHLQALKDDCDFCVMDEDTSPVHPFSTLFHWYQLHD